MITTRALRLYFLTELGSSGTVDIETLRNFAGHKDIRTTQRYLNTRQELLKKAANIMGDKISDAL